MFFKKKQSQERHDASGARRITANGPKTQAPNSEVKISTREIKDSVKVVRRPFPGPRGAKALLRVAIERAANAELIAHSKESLELEVCGVLVGRVCEDDEGEFVHVETIIRGAAASQGSTHVTFTQQTWNAIHKTLDRDFPDLKIVGWYHTHPGFGVEFSDMDLFIQRNFFAGARQIGLVTDPLSGAVAIIANTPEGPAYLPRFWIDGREQPCRQPAARKDGGADGYTESAEVATDAAAQGFRELESRINLLMQAVDDQRNQLSRFLLMAGLFFCLVLIALGGYWIWNQFQSRFEPPKNIGYQEFPVQIGTNVAWLGVQIVQMKLPPELDPRLIMFEQIRDQVIAQIRPQLIAMGIELTNVQFAPAPATNQPGPASSATPPATNSVPPAAKPSPPLHSSTNAALPSAQTPGFTSQRSVKCRLPNDLQSPSGNRQSPISSQPSFLSRRAPWHDFGLWTLDFGLSPRKSAIGNRQSAIL